MFCFVDDMVGSDAAPTGSLSTHPITEEAEEGGDGEEGGEEEEVSRRGTGPEEMQGSENKEVRKALKVGQYHLVVPFG